MTNLYKLDEEYSNLSTTNKMKDENINKARKAGIELFLGYGILANCDKCKYGDLIEGLENEYMLGDNKYPKTQKKHMSMQ